VSAVLLLLLLLTPTSHAAEADPIGEIHGALVLCGGGRVPDAARERFVELAGGPKAKLVVITASGIDPDSPAGEKILEPWKALKPASLVLFHGRDKKHADDAESVKPLPEATGVWFEGDDGDKVTSSYLGGMAETELKKMLEGGGVIGGSTMGCRLASKMVFDENGRYPRAVPGLNLLPGCVIEPQFLKRNRADRLIALLSEHPGLVGLGIDEGAAVIIKGGSIRVVGESYVTVCQAASKRRPASVQTLKAGEAADLIELRRAALARTHAFPPEKPAPPVVEKGTLIIGGGGAMPPEVTKKFIELAGGPDARIVVVSTALDDPVPEDPGEAKTLRAAGAKNVKILHTRSRAEANKPEFAAPLNEAGGVWFSGGRQWRFVDAYEGTLTEKMFHDVLKRGGVIGGSSAGASIQSEYMPRGHPLGNLVMMAEGYERGFGFLPGVAVDQHFFARKRQADMTELVRTYPQLLGIGIDEGTVIVVKGSVFQVVGKSKVAVFDRSKPVKDGEKDYEEIEAGMKYDMKARKQVEKE
jgi:cyanophycinase